MDPHTFQENLVGLSKSDKAKWNTRYYNVKNDTAGEKRQTYTLADKMLTDALESAELIERDDRNRITGDDNLLRIRARTEMLKYIDDLGPQTPEQLSQFVKKFAVKEIKDKTFKPDLPDRKKKTGFKMPSGKELTEAKKRFRAKYGRFPGPNDQKLFETFAQANS